MIIRSNFPFLHCNMAHRIWQAKNQQSKICVENSRILMTGESSVIWNFQFKWIFYFCFVLTTSRILMFFPTWSRFWSVDWTVDKSILRLSFWEAENTSKLGNWFDILMLISNEGSDFFWTLFSIFNLYLQLIFTRSFSHCARNCEWAVDSREKRKIMFSSSFIRFIAHSCHWKKSMNVARDEENWVAAARKILSIFLLFSSLKTYTHQQHWIAEAIGNEREKNIFMFSRNFRRGYKVSSSRFVLMPKNFLLIVVIVSCYFIHTRERNSQIPFRRRNNFVWEFQPLFGPEKYKCGNESEGAWKERKIHPKIQHRQSIFPPPN